jgi:hypothetical protein
MQLDVVTGAVEDHVPEHQCLVPHRV